MSDATSETRINNGDGKPAGVVTMTEYAACPTCGRRMMWRGSGSWICIPCSAKVKP